MTSCECGWPLREEGMSRYVCDNPNHSAEARCGMTETGDEAMCVGNLLTEWLADSGREQFDRADLLAFGKFAHNRCATLLEMYWAGARAAREQAANVAFQECLDTCTEQGHDDLCPFRNPDTVILALRLEGEPEPEVR